MKKVFTLIFSFYLLALAVMACSDKEDCKYVSTYKSISTATDHSNHDNDVEKCSPFCMCACCGLSYNFSYFPTDLGLNFQTSVIKTSFYNTCFVSEVSFSIWQPPKIS
ncbi:MAG: DUF6660 family protein [Bacteroidia bacterium]